MGSNSPPDEASAGTQVDMETERIFDSLKTQEPPTKQEAKEEIPHDELPVEQPENPSLPTEDDEGKHNGEAEDNSKAAEDNDKVAEDNNKAAEENNKAAEENNKAVEDDNEAAEDNKNEEAADENEVKEENDEVKEEENDKKDVKEPIEENGTSGTPELIPMTRPRRLRAPTSYTTPVIKLENVEVPAKKRGRPSKKSTLVKPASPQVPAKTTTTRARRSEPIKPDPEPQKEPEKCCRICLAKQDLTNIFSVDGDAPIANKVRMICSGLSISKKDALPQFICKKCVQSLNVALNFKTLGETTDQDLRRKLRRSRTYREPEFVVIDCGAGDEDIELDLNTDEDEEFKPPSDFQDGDDVVSDDAEADSDFSVDKSKSKRRKRTRPKRKGRKSKNSTVEINSDDSDTVPLASKRQRKQRRSSGGGGGGTSESKSNTHCIYCDKTFPTVNDLREHKKTHVGDKPFVCDICDRSFKFAGSFKAHKEHHLTSDNLMCRDCNKRYPNKTELRKHLFEVHGEPLAKFSCEKCKRSFTTEKRLDMHREAKCPGFDTSGLVTKKQKQEKKQEHETIALGRDLFKCVAPLTSTYWSDSFSE